jgi:hypothetical protein
MIDDINVAVLIDLNSAFARILDTHVTSCGRCGFAPEHHVADNESHRSIEFCEVRLDS